MSDPEIFVMLIVDTHFVVVVINLHLKMTNMGTKVWYTQNTGTLTQISQQITNLNQSTMSTIQIYVNNMSLVYASHCNVVRTTPLLFIFAQFNSIHNSFASLDDVTVCRSKSP